MNAAKPHRFSLATLVWYSALAMPLAALTGPVFAALPNHLVANLGLDQAAVGLALLLARVWDAVCDPLFGIYADRLKGRWGRRLPWIVAGLVPTLIGAGLLFLASPGISIVTVGLASALLYTGWTAIKLSHDAWGAELSGDYAERIRITGVREGLALVGGLIAISLLGWGVSAAPGGMAQAFGVLFWFVTLTLLFGTLLLVWRAPRPMLLAAPPLKLADVTALWRGQKALRKLSAGYFLNTLAAAFPATLFLPYVEFVLEAPTWRGPLILLYFLSAVLAMPLWSWASRRYGKDAAWRASILIAALFFAPAVFFRSDTEIWFALVCVVTGACLGGDLMLPPAMQADIADAQTVADGQERAGLLFALLGFLSKLAYALAVGIAFGILAQVGFDQRPEAQNDAGGVTMLAILYAGVPIALKLAAWACLRGYPLTAQRHAMIRAELEKRR
jgi:glycoside/pentoside/hexuronide:cation symporter, GPH family